MNSVLSFFADSFMENENNPFKLEKGVSSKLDLLQLAVQSNYEALKENITDTSAKELLDQMKDCLRSEEFEYGKIKFCEGFRMGMLLMLEINSSLVGTSDKPIS